MSYLGRTNLHQPPLGMTSITGVKLEGLKAMYNSILGSVLHAQGEETLLFSHFGSFTQNKIDSTLKLVEGTLLESGEKRQSVKRFCNLLIEVLQNMSLHGARDRSGQMHSYVVISKTATSYRLMTGNLLLAEDVAPLNHKMKELVEMDSDELRKLYIETLCNEEYSTKGGAGLGLLTVAKRAEKNIKYNLHNIDEHFGYFQLEVSMNHD